MAATGEATSAAVKVTRHAQPGTFGTVTRMSLAGFPPQHGTYEPGGAVRKASKEVTFKHIGKTRRIYVSGRPGTTPAPAVFLLHGAGRTGLSMIDMWQDMARKKGVILIAPDAISGSWTSKDMDAGFVEKAIKAAERIRPIDRERIFLFGHYAGAVHAAKLLNADQAIWRAGALHGGFPGKFAPVARPDAPPFRIYLGTEDHIFSIEDAKRTGQRFSKAGHDTELHAIPGHNHWFYVIGPALAADTWAWFRSQPGPAAKFQRVSN